MGATAANKNRSSQNRVKCAEHDCVIGLLTRQKRPLNSRPSFRVVLLRGNKTLVCEELNDCLQNEQLPGSETSASGFYEKQIPFVAVPQLLKVNILMHSGDCL